MYGRGHTQGTRTQTASQSAWYADIEAANIRDAEDAERTLVEALAAQVGNAIVAMPEAAERITKAAKLVQAQALWPLSSGAYLVGSQSDAMAAHLVSRGPWSCDCRWTQTWHTLCSHQLAVMLSIKMGDAYQPRYT